MLGENHSIHHEFPDFHQKIDESPISDPEMERLKQDRIRLKDEVYHRLSHH
jgi:uncharacterized protein YdcH (DUF465 family)